MEPAELSATLPAGAVQEPAPAWIGIGLDLILLAMLLVLWRVVKVPTVVFLVVFVVGCIVERRLRRAAATLVARRRWRRRTPTS